MPESARLDVGDAAVAEKAETTTSLRRTRLHRTIVIVGLLVVFAAHFRPWEIAFLEEWPLAEFWMDRGGFTFAQHYAEWSLSRPLHLVPTALGLALAGGAPFGIWVVLGIVAAGQFGAVLWALRPVSQRFWINAAVALLIALHPLWPGGFLQRFLPAQTAALGMILMAGFLIRYLVNGRIRFLVGGALVLIAGLLVYPGPAAAAPLLAVVIALAVSTSWRRRIWVVAVAVVATGIVTLYSLVITRLVAPDAASYEAGNFSAGSRGGPREIVELIWASLTGPGLALSFGILAIVVVAVVLAVARAIPPFAAVLMAGAALVSPLCAAVFFGNIAWLHDVERIAYATSLGLVAALMVWPIAARDRAVRLQQVVAALAVVAALVGAISGVVRWQPYIALQHQLFAELAPVVEEAEGDDVVVVVDHSGTFGTEYTLPQYYISSASRVVNGDHSAVWLCSLAEDPPLAGGPVCTPADTGEDLRLVRSFEVPNGEVELFIGTR